MASRDNLNQGRVTLNQKKRFIFPQPGGKKIKGKIVESVASCGRESWDSNDESESLVVNVVVVDVDVFVFVVIFVVVVVLVVWLLSIVIFDVATIMTMMSRTLMWSASVLKLRRRMSGEARGAR
jgi:hypothetical protein